MAAVRHIGFVVTSSYFIRVLCNYVSNIVLNFHLLGFLLSDILGVSCFIILAGNCLFRANFLRVLGVNRGQISIFHFITPIRHILARFRVF